MAPQVPGIKETTTFPQLIKGVCDGGEVEVDVGLSHVFDVEGDDLLFQDEEVLDEEEVGVGRGAGGGDERGGVVEGEGRGVDDLVGEVVEDGGLERPLATDSRMENNLGKGERVR